MCGNQWGVLLAALFTGHFVATAALATSLNLANDPATGGSGKVAAEEIRREASAKGMTLGEDAATTRVALTVDRDAKAVAQGCSIRVPNDGGRRAITVRAGADIMPGMRLLQVMPSGIVIERHGRRETIALPEKK